MNGLVTVILLFISNVFMTLAWYGHLKMREYNWFNALSLIIVIFISWGIAFFEYCSRCRKTGLASVRTAGLFHWCNSR